MVGDRQLVLKEILNEKQILHVLKQTIGDDLPCHVKNSEVRPAIDGIAGFLGDHIRAVLHVDVQGEVKDVHLFIKRLPASNKPKAEYIDELNFNRREMLMFKLIEEIGVDDPNPWYVKAYINTESLIVMPDLQLEAYATQHFHDTLDYEHIFVTTTSIARFHAAFVNYETKKSIDLKRPYNILQEFGKILAEPTFCDSSLIRSAAKLSANFLKEFSTKSYRNTPDLESKLARLYVDACNSLVEHKDTLNILLHRDLWVNNIMFKHENGVPVNAVLVDYQCLRYGPPAFDLIMFLYLTTDKRFRQEREKDICDYYYSIFVKNLNDDSKKRLNGIGYNKKSFIEWCEKARMFGILVAIVIFPFILMDPKTAQKTFDDPETYEKLVTEDRSEPVIAYANESETYKRRMLAVTEEFIETFMLEQL